MKIKINDHRKIQAIQGEFNRVFKNLKLVFLTKPHTKAGEPGAEISNENNSTLGACRIIHNKGEITITPEMKIRELQERFADVYGLGILVYKKSGNTWINAAEEAGLTLLELNKLAKPKRSSSKKTVSIIE